MPKFSQFALVAIAATSLFTACKKDEESSNAVTGAARKTTLVANKWALTASSWGPANLLDSLEACERDNYLTFTTGGQYFEMEGTTKCGTMDTADKGTYGFSADFSKMIIDGDTATVSEFKENTFTTKVNALGLEYKETYTKK